MIERRKQERKSVIVPMSQYGDVADKRWFARMSGKLYLLTEMAKEEKDKRRRKA